MKDILKILQNDPNHKEIQLLKTYGKYIYRCLVSIYIYLDSYGDKLK